MPFLAPIFGAIGTALGGLAGIGKMLVGLIINVGLSLLQMLMMPKPPKPDDIQTVYRQSVPVRNIHAGRVRTGGPLLIAETKGRRFYAVVYFGEGPVDAYEEFFVDNRPVTLSANGWVTSEPYKYESGKGGERNAIRIETRTGEPTGTAYQSLISWFGGFINKDFRGDGLATGLIIAKTVPQRLVGKILPNRLPALMTVARFGKPYDPRTGQEVWSSNFPILLLYYLTHLDGVGISRSLFDLAEWGDCANHADRFLPTKSGGTVRRYHGSVSWKMDEQPSEVIKRILMHFDGRLYLKSNGLIGLKVGRWETPTVHIEDRFIWDADIKTLPPATQEASETVVKYSNPATGYMQSTCQPWRDEDVHERINGGDGAGGKVRNTTVELFGIQSHNHARRIAKILNAKANPRYNGTLVGGLYLLKLWDQRFFSFDYEDLGIAGATAEVNEITFDDSTNRVTVLFQTIEASAYDFDPETEEGTAPVDPALIDPDNPPEPRGFAADATVEVVGGRRVGMMTLTVEEPIWPTGINTEPEDDDDKLEIDVEFQYAVADSGRWRPINGVQEEYEAVVRNLADGGVYDARVRFRANNGLGGPWAEIENINIIADPVAPGVPTAVTVVSQGVRTARVSWVAPNSPNYARANVYRGTTSIASAATLVETVYGAPNSAGQTDDIVPSAGTYFYFVAAANDSNTPSARVPAGSVELS